MRLRRPCSPTLAVLFAVLFRVFRVFRGFLPTCSPFLCGPCFPWTPPTLAVLRAAPFSVFCVFCGFSPLWQCFSQSFFCVFCIFRGFFYLQYLKGVFDGGLHYSVGCGILKRNSPFK